MRRFFLEGLLLPVEEAFVVRVFKAGSPLPSDADKESFYSIDRALSRAREVYRVRKADDGEEGLVAGVYDAGSKDFSAPKHYVGDEAGLPELEAVGTVAAATAKGVTCPHCGGHHLGRIDDEEEGRVKGYCSDCGLVWDVLSHPNSDPEDIDPSQTVVPGDPPHERVKRDMPTLPRLWDLLKEKRDWTKRNATGPIDYVVDVTPAGGWDAGDVDEVVPYPPGSYGASREVGPDDSDDDLHKKAKELIDDLWDQIEKNDFEGWK